MQSQPADSPSVAMDGLKSGARSDLLLQTPPPSGFLASLIQGNFFYPLSAIFFLLASFLLMPAQNVIGEKLLSTLQAALILQGYELLLILSAAVIVRRLRVLSDACTLLLIEIVLLLDPTFFTNSFLGLRTLPGTSVNLLLLALAPLKLAVILRALHLRISPRAWAAFMLALAGIYLGPAPLYWLTIRQPPQAPQALYFYALLWMLPALAMLTPRVREAVGLRAAPGFATRLQLLRVRRAIVWLPLIVLGVHLAECVWVNEETLRWLPVHAAPVLLSAAILYVRRARPRRATAALTVSDLLCVAALFFSLPGHNASGFKTVMGNLRPVDVLPSYVAAGLPLLVAGLGVVGLYLFAWRRLRAGAALWRVVLLAAAGLVYAFRHFGWLDWMRDKLQLLARELGLLVLDHPDPALAAALVVILAIAWRWRSEWNCFAAGVVAIVLGMRLAPDALGAPYAEGFQALCALVILVDAAFHGRRNISVHYVLAFMAALVGIADWINSQTVASALIVALGFAALLAGGLLPSHRGLLLVALLQAGSVVTVLLVRHREHISPAYLALTAGLLLFAVGLVVTFNKQRLLSLLPAEVPLPNSTLPTLSVPAGEVNPSSRDDVPR